MTQPYQEERARFAQVMAARKSATELISLFDKLCESEKFSIWAKPYCFADLLETCAARVPASALDALLEAVILSWAGDVLWRVYPEDVAGQKAWPLVRKAIEASKGPGVLERRLRALRSGGVLRNLGQAVALAEREAYPPDLLAALRAQVGRFEAQPSPAQECPF